MKNATIKFTTEICNIQFHSYEYDELFCRNTEHFFLYLRNLFSKNSTERFYNRNLELIKNIKNKYWSTEYHLSANNTTQDVLKIKMYQLS